MPVLSCGGMRYQNAWTDQEWSEIPDAGQANLEATVHRALELGINHIETARGYGTSEMQLSRILPQLPRDQIVVQTKVRPMPTPDEFRRVVEESMNYLKLDYVDLLALHGINNGAFHDRAFLKGSFQALQEYKEQGLCRHIGFSTHANLDVILRTIADGDFDYINLHWYYIFQHNWPAIEAARAKDMGVFIISPSNKGGMLYEPSDVMRRLCEPLHPMIFNDLFCLNHLQVHTISVGAARPSDFDEHLEAVSMLDQAVELVAPIRQRLDERMKKTLGTDWLENWSHGLAGPVHNINDINVFILLWLRNLIIAFDMTVYGKNRYAWFGDGGDWFGGKPIESEQEIRDLNLEKLLSDHPFAEQLTEKVIEAWHLLRPGPREQAQRIH